jgi:hypothetical protein
LEPEKKKPVPETESKGITVNELLKKVSNETPHNFTFGEVYANDLAKNEIEKDTPNFPLGSIIVREKNLTSTSETPETVIAMVKREKGFSEKTGDWEFFVFDGKDLQMQKRETVGNCSACHSNAKESDWVFRDYLK